MKTIQTYLARKKIEFIVFLVALVGFPGLLIAYFITSSDQDNVAVLLIVALPLLLLFGIFYAASYHPIVMDLKRLSKQGMSHIADDIVLDQPTMPKSRIYCGQQALFCKSPFAILPYSDVAWVYLSESSDMLSGKKVVIYTKSGRKLSMQADGREWQWLIENYIIRFSPNVIIGFGEEQRKRYGEVNPAYARAFKNNRRVGGLLLMVFGGLFLLAAVSSFRLAEEGVFNPAWQELLVGSGCLIGGWFLFRKGSEHKK